MTNLIREVEAMADGPNISDRDEALLRRVANQLRGLYALEMLARDGYGPTFTQGAVATGGRVGADGLMTLGVTSEDFAAALVAIAITSRRRPAHLSTAAQLRALQEDGLPKFRAPATIPAPDVFDVIPEGDELQSLSPSAHRELSAMEVDSTRSSKWNEHTINTIPFPLLKTNLVVVQLIDGSEHAGTVEEFEWSRVGYAGDIARWRYKEVTDQNKNRANIEGSFKNAQNGRRRQN